MKQLVREFTVPIADTGGIHYPPDGVAMIHERFLDGAIGHLMEEAKQLNIKDYSVREENLGNNKYRVFLLEQENA